MDHNPYTPPQSEVGTGFVGGPPSRRTVSIWIALLLVGLYILQQMLVLKMLSRFYAAGSVSDLFVFWSGVRTLLWVAALVAIAFGRNWGRILLVLLTVYAAFTIVPSAWRMLANPPDPTLGLLPGFLGLLPLLVCVLAIYLLFGPGRHWFAKRAAPG